MRVPGPMLVRLLVGVAVGAAGAFVVALLRPQRRAQPPGYVAPVPPGDLWS